MNLLRKLTAFILVFILLSGTVAVMSAAVYVDDAPEEAAEIAPVAAAVSDTLTEVSADGASYTPRLSAPAATNPYYYSDKNVFYKYGWGMPNCTCYAWGRAYEITKKEPDLCVYSAYLWYDYNIEYGIYPYGSEPKLGAIACWVYTSGDCGHVAVVEKIENNQITFSNSAYSGTLFYTNTAPINDPSDGRETWIFQGYIYVCDYENPDADTNTVSATDGDPDADEPVSGDAYIITDEDGVNLRTKAGTSSDVIGSIVFGKTLTVTKIESADGYIWGYTTYNGRKGWFALDFAEPVQRDDEEPPATEPVIEEPPVTEPADDDKPSGPIIGDVDSDGMLTILDATRIQRLLAKIVEADEYMLSVGDFDGDGNISVLDATRIRREIARID